MSTQVCPVGKNRGVNRGEGYRARDDDEERVPTPLAEEGELLVAVLGVPAVKASFVHAFNLKALQLSTEDAVLGGGGLPKVGQALGRQKNLHRSCQRAKSAPWSDPTAAVYVKCGFAD